MNYPALQLKSVEMRLRLLYLDLVKPSSPVKASWTTTPSHTGSPTGITKNQKCHDGSQHQKASPPGPSLEPIKDGSSSDLAMDLSTVAPTTPTDTANMQRDRPLTPFAGSIPLSLFLAILLAFPQPAVSLAFDTQSPSQPSYNGQASDSAPGLQENEGSVDWPSTYRLLAATYILLLAFKFHDLIRVVRSPDPLTKPRMLSAYLVAASFVAPVAWAAIATDDRTSRSDCILIGTCNIVTCLSLDAELWANLGPYRREQARFLFAMVLVRGSWLIACVCLKKPAATDSLSQYLYQALLGTSFLATNLMALGVWMWLSSTSSTTMGSGSPV